MSMQVTPGFGTFIATREKGNAHHQEIVTHSDHAISKATPTLVEGGVYNNGDVIGNEITFNNVTRFANDTAVLKEVCVIITDMVTPTADMLLVLYREPLISQPFNGGKLNISATEMENVLAAIDIKPSDFKVINDNFFLKIPVDTVIFSGIGNPSIRGTLLVSNGVFTSSSSSPIMIQLITERD